MKIIQLDCDKVKVTLSQNELSDMDINIDDLKIGTPELSLFLFGVIEAVKRKTSFHAEENEIIVEATKDSGGITLILSRLPRSRTSPKKSRNGSGNVTFELEAFNDFCELIKNIPPAYLLSMRLYEYDKKFYLVLPRRKIPVLLYEYSVKNRKSEILESFLLEHGSLLADSDKIILILSFLKKTS